MKSGNLQCVFSAAAWRQRDIAASASVGPSSIFLFSLRTAGVLVPLPWRRRGFSLVVHLWTAEADVSVASRVHRQLEPLGQEDRKGQEEGLHSRPAQLLHIWRLQPAAWLDAAANICHSPTRVQQQHLAHVLVSHLLDVQLDAAAPVLVQRLEGSCSKTQEALSTAATEQQPITVGPRAPPHSRNIASSRTRQPTKLSKSMSSCSSL